MNLDVNKLFSTDEITIIKNTKDELDNSTE